MTLSTHPERAKLGRVVSGLLASPTELSADGVAAAHREGEILPGLRSGYAHNADLWHPGLPKAQRGAGKRGKGLPVDEYRQVCVYSVGPQVLTCRCRGGKARVNYTTGL